VLLAAFRGGWVVALWLLLVALAMGGVERVRRGEEKELRMVKRFVEVLRSVYAVSPTFIQAMKKAAAVFEPEDPVRQAVERAGEVYDIRGTEEAFLQALMESPLGYLRKFARLVRNLPRGDQEGAAELLENFAGYLRRLILLRGAINTALQAVGFTALALQGANLGALALCLFAPMWSDFFLATWRRQLLLCFFHGMMVLALLYFEEERKSLARRML